MNLALGNLEDAKTDYSEVLKVKPDNDLAKTQVCKALRLFMGC